MQVFLKCELRSRVGGWQRPLRVLHLQVLRELPRPAPPPQGPSVPCSAPGLLRCTVLLRSLPLMSKSLKKP